MNYLRTSEATISDIKPGARLYVSLGEHCYVARIGFNQDFAVYKGGTEWGLDTVADHGIPSRLFQIHSTSLPSSAAYFIKQNASLWRYPSKLFIVFAPLALSTGIYSTPEMRRSRIPLTSHIAYRMGT